MMNAILKVVPSALIDGRLKAIDVLQGDVFAEPGLPIERAIFPESALLSVVVTLNDGAQVEAAMIGPTGMFGAAAIFGAKQHVSTVVAQLPGRASAVSPRDLTEIASECPEFRRLILAQERYLLAQAQQTAACNATHSIAQRVCTWLLRAQDEAGRDEFLVTQEMLAKMLGVQRASVSMFAGQLQEQGLVQYRRGRLQITDADGLAAHACECHRAVRSHRERLFGSAARLEKA